MASQDVVVVGAGVIGLTTAVCLAEAGLGVACWTRAPPRETTSRVAGAMWGSSLAGPADKVVAWAEVSLAELRELAGRPGTGVHIATGTLASRRLAEPPPPQMFPGVPVRPRPAAPNGYLAAFEVEVPLLDMPRYLGYLEGRLQDAGTSIEIRAVRSLDDAAAVAWAVINCTGLGARELVPDASVRPVRGQHVVVENPGLEEFFMEDPFAAEWTSWFPHAEHVILGGIAQPDATDPQPDPDISAGILARCATRAWSSTRSASGPRATRCAWRSSRSAVRAVSTITATAEAVSDSRGAARARSRPYSRADQPRDTACARATHARLKRRARTCSFPSRVVATPARRRKRGLPRVSGSQAARGGLDFEALDTGFRSCESADALAASCARLSLPSRIESFSGRLRRPSNRG
jgi:D-amino-acid oxidase